MKEWGTARAGTAVLEGTARDPSRWTDPATAGTAQFVVPELHGKPECAWGESRK